MPRDEERRERERAVEFCCRIVTISPRVCDICSSLVAASVPALEQQVGAELINP